MYGKGLNSIRIRFTIVIVVQLLMLLGFELARSRWMLAGSPHEGAWNAGCVALIALFGFVVYLMTGRLTRPIENLRASTEAIARGDYDAAVDVTCNCEVGGLSESFNHMVDRMNASVSRINKLAYEDVVTSLPNRAVLTQFLETHGWTRPWVLFIDLDHFKRVNDTFGHKLGDQLLNEAASRLAGALNTSPDAIRASTRAECQNYKPSEPLLFRFASDEFVAVLDGHCSKAEASLKADMMIAALEQPFMLNGTAVRVGCSIGVSRLDDESQDALEILKFTDIAMLAAKKSGRNTVVFFDEAMRQAFADENRLEAELFRAIENHEFVLHYQPKVSLVTGQVNSVEALVRWQHPTAGLLPPSRFLPTAESSGQMEKIGRQVMAMAANQAAEWKRQGLDIKVAVNVCPTQFLNENFAREMLQAMETMQIDPGLIDVELTETVAMADPVRASRQLKTLRSHGIRISIDDYGVGYSNLSQLYSLPFDVLKLDRSLVQNLLTNEGARTIAAATIRMAHALGHTVVAEGVENQAEADMLRGEGCDEVQGFHFARPMPAEIFREWLNTHQPQGPATPSNDKGGWQARMAS